MKLFFEHLTAAGVLGLLATILVGAGGRIKGVRN